MSPLSLRLFFFLLIALNGLAVTGLILGQDPSFYKSEDGLLENLQALILLLAMIVALIQYWGTREQGGLIPLTLALIFFSGLLRELDVEHYDIPGILIMLGSGIGKRILLAALWLPLIARVVKRRREVWEELQQLLRQLSGRCLVLAPVLIVLGGLVDKELLELPRHVFFEELFELNAYAMFLLAALALRPLDSRAEASAVSLQ